MWGDMEGRLLQQTMTGNESDPAVVRPDRVSGTMQIAKRGFSTKSMADNPSDGLETELSDPFHQGPL